MKQKDMFSFFSRASTSESRKSNQVQEPENVFPQDENKNWQPKVSNATSSCEKHESTNLNKSSNEPGFLVGKKVRVFWPLDNAWYEGTVSTFKKETMKYTIVYDDGESEVLDLKSEKFEIISEQNLNPTPNYRMIIDSESENELEDVKSTDITPLASKQSSSVNDEWMAESSDSDGDYKSSKTISRKRFLKGADLKTPISKKNKTGPSKNGAAGTTPSPNDAGHEESNKGSLQLGMNLDAFRSPTAVTNPRNNKLTPIEKQLASASVQLQEGSDDEPVKASPPGVEQSSEALDAVWLRDGVLNIGRHMHDDWAWLKEGEGGERRDKFKRKKGDTCYDARTLFVPPAVLAKETPAMQQWWQFKSENMDTVLFFKVGKFYELFHMDADVGMKELDLIYMKGDKAHSGFPEIAYGKMAAALVSKGYKVARVEQTETPEMMKARNLTKPGKPSKVVEREVCSILTRGTRTFCYMDQVDEDLDFNPSSNILISIKEKKLDIQDQEQLRDSNGHPVVPPVCEYGLCILNAPTSQFLLGQFADGPLRPRLRTLLAQMPPVEVLSQEGNLSDITISMLRNSGRMPTVESLQEEEEFWGPKKTIHQLKKGKYFHSESKQEDDDETNSGVSRWPSVVRAVVEGKADSELVLSSLGATVYWIQRAMIDHDLLTMHKFGAYIPPDLEDCLSGDEPAMLSFTPPEDPTTQFGFSGAKKMVLDGNALCNLEVLCNSADGGEPGSLWAHLNHCSTPFGRRLLREWTVRPLLQISDIERRLEAVEELAGPLSVEAVQVKSLLAKLPDVERLLSRVHSMGSSHRSNSHPDSRAIMYEDDKYTQRKIRDFSQVLQALKVMQGIPRCFHQKKITSTYLRKLIANEPEGCFPDCSNILDFFDQIFDAKQAEKDGFITTRPGMDSDYDNITEEIENINKELDNYLREQRKALGCNAICYWGKNKDRCQLEIPIDALKKGQPAGYELKSQKKGYKRFRTKILDRAVADLEKAEAELELYKKDHLRKIFERFDSSRELWSSLVTCVAHLDALQSLSEVASYPGYSKPEFVPTPSTGPFIHLQEARHPCIAQTFQKGHFIPNDTFLGETPETQKPCLMLLSGPNMGGKSTLLRQTCLIAIMAQMGCYVPAELCVLTPVDRIFTRLGATDRILAGESTFFVELGETSTILHSATQDSLVILDELGRGTSTFDGTAIAHAVVEHLTLVGCRSIFATHYHSLVEDWSRSPKVMLGHMSCFVEPEAEEQKVTFLYKLSPGASPKSYGLNVARLARLPKEVLKIAQKKSTEFELMMSSQMPQKSAHKELLMQLKEIVNSSKLSVEDKSNLLFNIWSRVGSGLST